MKKFANIAELAGWLEDKGIDMRSWGRGPYKSITNLWDEYVAGEVFFEDDPPVRIVQVIQILIQQNDRSLREVEQEFGNGERRFRNQPPAEKVKSNETGVDAAQRCLREELGLSSEQIEWISVENEQEEMVADSPSYPGLQTRYMIQEIKARVIGLPEEDFWRENRAAAEGDPVSRHLWGWRAQA